MALASLARKMRKALSSWISNYDAPFSFFSSFLSLYPPAHQLTKRVALEELIVSSVVPVLAERVSLVPNGETQSLESSLERQRLARGDERVRRGLGDKY